MQRLESADLLELWERGQGRHPVDRALVVLAFACRDRSWDDLCSVPVGERNRLVLLARALTFGSRMDIVAACPGCGLELEFDFTLPDDYPPVATREVEAELPGRGPLRLRLPDSRDLAAVAALTDAAAAQAHLLSRCVISPPLAPGDEMRASAVAEAFSLAVERHDPLAVIAFPLACSGCGRAWRAILDPIDYTWRQLTQRVWLLIRDIHALARAYGWTEGEVLRLSPARRQMYLDHVGA